MAKGKPGETRLTFFLEKELHEAFRVACGEDSVSQAAFIRHMVKAYVEKNKWAIRLVEELRGTAKNDAKQRIKNLQKEDYKDFYDLDEDDIENIFDRIEEANPDL